MRILLLHSQADATASIALAEQLQRIPNIEVGGRISLPANSQPLPQADVTLLLLSRPFLADGVQNNALLDDALAQDTELIAVILKKCDWDESPYVGLAILPEDRIALETKGSTSILDFLSEKARLFHLKQDAPAAFSKLQKQQAKKETGPSLFFLSTRFAWKLLPQKIKWGLASLLGAAILLLIYFSFLN